MTQCCMVSVYLFAWVSVHCKCNGWADHSLPQQPPEGHYIFHTKKCSFFARNSFNADLPTLQQMTRLSSSKCIIYRQHERGWLKWNSQQSWFIWLRTMLRPFPTTWSWTQTHNSNVACCRMFPSARSALALPYPCSLLSRPAPCCWHAGLAFFFKFWVRVPVKGWNDVIPEQFRERLRPTSSMLMALSSYSDLWAATKAHQWAWEEDPPPPTR
jgi:hypothetical protein